MKRKLDWNLISRDVEIVFEDDELIVLNKPSPFLVLPDRYDKSIPDLSTILNEGLGRVFVVHRIDKETSGLIVFAKTPESHRNLSGQFESHSVEKTYEAIVHGFAEKEEGVIDLPIMEKHAGVMVVDKKRGKPSRTPYKVLAGFAGYTHLELRPESGRMHQIRVHLKAIGLPILCDPVYGNGQPFFLSQIKAKYRMKEEEQGAGGEKPVLARTALHASELGFVHPVIGRPLKVNCGLPKDMRSVLRMLDKYSPRTERTQHPN